MKISLIPLALISCVSLSAFQPCLSHKAAKRLAEDATGGVAVRSRKVPQNGSLHAWEVLVRMPNDNHGWRVRIDRDTGKVLKKESIDNPPARQ